MAREKSNTGLKTLPICLPEVTCYSAAAAVGNTSRRIPATSTCERQVTVNHYRYQVTQSTYLAAAATLGSTASFINARYVFFTCVQYVGLPL